MFGGGIGVVAHLRKHALVLAAHACSEVAGGDRLQQAGERLQIAIGGGHQGVEAFHHDAEIELELLGIAARGEITIGRSLRQLLDLGIHRAQVVLDLIHRRGDGGFFAGQLRHVFRQVADGVTLDQVDGLHLDLDVRGHQLVGVISHAAEVARECGGVHTEADVAFFMALGHAQLCGNQIAQLSLHAVHGVQQPAGFVIGLRADVVVQLALGNGFCSAGGTRQRNDQAAGDQPCEHAADQHNHQAAADQQGTAAGHRRGGDCIGFLGALALQRRIFQQRVLPRLRGRCGMLQQQGHGLGRLAREVQIDHLLVERACGLVVGIDLVANRLGHRRCREGVELVVCVFVDAALLFDDRHEVLIFVVWRRQHDVAQLHRDDRHRVIHFLQALHDDHVAVGQRIQALARLRQRIQAGDHQGAGQQDQRAEGKGQALADVVALKKSDHG